MAASIDPSAVEVALRERLEALTVELAARDQRIAQQDATINALLSRVTEFESRPAA
jgi:Arc/MetJ family transcription regulator